MSEEEKKAIEILNNIEYKDLYSDKFYDNRDIVLNLIEKQQKEIEELKEENAEQLEVITEWVNGERINDIKHISKDKIKEKIKELEEEIEEKQENCLDFTLIHEHEIDTNGIIEVLEELLEE